MIEYDALLARAVDGLPRPSGPVPVAEGDYCFRGRPDVEVLDEMHYALIGVTWINLDVPTCLISIRIDREGEGVKLLLHNFKTEDGKAFGGFIPKSLGYLGINYYDNRVCAGNWNKSNTSIEVQMPLDVLREGSKH